MVWVKQPDEKQSPRYTVLGDFPVRKCLGKLWAHPCWCPTSRVPRWNIKPAWVNKGQGETKEKRQIPPDCQMAGVISKVTYILGLSWVATRWIDLRTHLPESWVNIEALKGFSHIFSPDGLNSTLLSSRLCPWSSSSDGNSGQNVHSKDRVEGKESLIAWVQLAGQVVAMSSW